LFRVEMRKFPGTVYVDADWVGDMESRKSTAGMVVFCDFSPIDWRSNKIKGTISLSSTEAEVNAIAAAMRRLMYVHPIFEEKGYGGIAKSTRVMEDNQLAIHIIQQTGCNSKRSKHYDVKVKYVINIMVKRDVGIVKVRTQDQIADFLTKHLATPQFRDARRSVMVDIREGITGINERERYMTAKLGNAGNN